jgi:signal transduction histidine kinase
VVEATGPLELGLTVRACWETVDTGDAELLIEDDATILADEDRLRQVFENLFRNCIEHGVTDGEPAPDAADPLTVRVGVLPTDDGVYVEDDGPGIPEERRREVFEQGYSTTTGGTGLGLAIVEKMATAHGWTVAVTQGREGGARIEISGVEVD